MKLFKKKEKNVPPDIGSEDELTKITYTKEASNNSNKGAAQLQQLQQAVKGTVKGTAQIERIVAKIEVISNLIRDYSERFAALGQQVGEIREMAVANEKAISGSAEKASLAMDMVKEVKPDKLRADYQRLDTKLNLLTDKLTMYKQFADSVLNELKDVRQKMGIFIGTEALLKLNEEVKTDIIEVQRIAAQVRKHADKSEQIFIDLQKESAKNENLRQVVNSLDSSYSGLSSEIEKLKVDHSNVASHSELNDLKEEIEKKFTEARLEDERVSKIIQALLSVAKKNKSDIADIAMLIGESNIKKGAEYEKWLNSILNIVDSIAEEVSEIKKRLGMKPSKIVVQPVDAIEGEKINMENLKIPIEISKALISRNKTPVDGKKIIEELKTFNRQVGR